MTDKQKNKRDLTVQIRISSKEKQMVEELRQIDPDFNVSRLFREFLSDYYEKTAPERGVGAFEIG